LWGNSTIYGGAPHLWGSNKKAPESKASNLLFSV
jgi:hypothetical protein